MIMRQSRANSRQFDLDFGAKPLPEAKPTEPLVPKDRKETPKTVEAGTVYRFTPTVDSDDRDEDPRAQTAREWREFRGRRRA